MKFIRIPPAQASGGILAHAQKTAEGRIAKGQKLTAVDIQQLQQAGIKNVAVAFLEAEDTAENVAATAIGDIVCGAQLSPQKAVHGRVNLFACCAGLLTFDRSSLTALNRISPDITLATLPPLARVEKGQMVATVKIISFAAPTAAVAAAQKFTALLAVQPYQKMTAVLVQTRLPALAERVLDKTAAITARRLAALDNNLSGEWRCAHDRDAVATTLRAIHQTAAPDLYLIAGASAVCDLADEVPAGLLAAGGSVARFGMPVDPGNLLVLGEFNKAPCIILPGCARSPKLNGFDWILARLLAGIKTDSDDIAALGAGGLLEDIVERPARRSTATPIINAILLAAGTSARFGDNKLLRPWRGKPLVCHAAGILAKAQHAGLIQRTVAVCGRDAEAVAALLEMPTINNPDYESGMASSLRRGLQEVGGDDAVLVMLADMPLVQVEDIAAVTAAFGTADIVVPAYQGKRGNPVLLGRRHFATLSKLQGDIGARALFAEHVIAEVPTGSGVLFDIDRPGEAVE